MTLAQRERHELADLMDEVGPDAPTLCEGWTAHDMAAHLWIRESDPAGMPGILVAPLASVTEARMEAVKQDLPYAQLVDRVRTGPGPLSVFRLVDSSANALEYLIHHEDVRRGSGRRTAPREMSLEDEAEVLSRLSSMAPMLVRPTGVRLAMVPEGTSDEVVFGNEGDVVRVTARPVELALIAFGRGAAAVARVEGSDRDIRLLADQGYELP